MKCAVCCCEGEDGKQCCFKVVVTFCDLDLGIKQLAEVNYWNPQHGTVYVVKKNKLLSSHFFRELQESCQLLS